MFRQFYWMVFITVALATGEAVLAENLQPNRLVYGELRVVEAQGDVEYSVDAAKTWEQLRTNQTLSSFCLLRTSINSRCAVLWSDRSVISFGASTEIEILPPQSESKQAGLRLIGGIISFFHRDKPGQIQILTRGAAAGIEGTDFAMAVDQAQRTAIWVVDGKVTFGNALGSLLVTNGQQGQVALGKPPTLAAGFIANNVLQWMFYYPAVIDLNELKFTDGEKQLLNKSLAAYQSGNLAEALRYFPMQSPDSTSVDLYHSALLLSVGNVEGSEKILSSLPDHSDTSQRLAGALRRVIAAVKRQADERLSGPKLASEYLADSYYAQSGGIRGVSLNEALELAKQAVAVSPEFGQAWERVAELEFCFGRTQKSLAALGKSLSLTPQNPKALALKGFLLAAQNRPSKAISVFDQALAINPALGDAWLGRGLCLIRTGNRAKGAEDLLVAAAIEPQRAELRSYLGKAYSDSGDFAHAEKELELAKALDPKDPTAWLYSALLNLDRNRLNTAIEDLEKSEDLNDNRRVYRSVHLLDQDLAVRSANLAAIYSDNGMKEVGLNEAQKAINYDYDNYSAHLFLANSYDALRDPNEINLRYETPDESEYLVANLLAPASAGTLSPTISQNEYSRLFQQDGFGVASETEYLSRGAWSESGAQFGAFKDFSYDFESFYRSDPGQRPNNDIYQRQLSLALKQQITPQDNLFFQVSDYEMNGGDLEEYYNQGNANQTLRVNETQRPIVGLGYNHEWAPGVNTLFYATRLNDRISLTNATWPDFTVFIPPIGHITGVDTGVTMQQDYTGLLDIYSGELQQIFEGTSHTTILGSRLQYGHFHNGNLENSPIGFGEIYSSTDTYADQSYNTLFKRLTFYGYHDWEILDSLRLIGGVTYDYMYFPANFRIAPLSGQEETEHQVSPKAGLVWTPTDQTTFRMAYTRSLGGASLDQSIQIEPSQVAGFIQSYRSIIPESIAGGNAGAHFET